MKVSGQVHVPADLPWERNAVKIRQEAECAPERVSMSLKKGQLFSSCRDSSLGQFRQQPRRYTDYSMQVKSGDLNSTNFCDGM